jgi:site-specific recombinase XerD
VRLLDAPTVSAYLEGLQVSAASVKLTASALRHWLDFLTQRGVLPFNPALSVRTARLVVTEGKTPVLEREEARALFASLDGSSLLELRDRAMFAVMLFGFVRVSAVCKMTVRDFEDESATAFLVLHEKGGKERRIPCHHQMRE